MNIRLAAWIIFSTLLPLSSNAAEPTAQEVKWYAGYSIETGISGEFHGLRILRKDTFDAEMVPKKDITYVPYLQLNGADNYFGDSRFGYNVFATYRTFKFDYQYGNFGNQDLGTSAKGYYAFITPQLFVDLLRGERSTLKLGAGIGVGRIHAEGTYRPGNMPSNSIETFSVSKNGTAPGVMLELRYGKVVGRFSAIQTNVKDPEGNKYYVFKAVGDIGYRFTF